jgi:hypothetical protein
VSYRFIQQAPDILVCNWLHLAVDAPLHNSPALKQYGLQLCPAQVDSSCMGCWPATNNDHIRTDLLFDVRTAAAVSQSPAVALSEFCCRTVLTCRPDCKGRSLAALFFRADPKRLLRANDVPSLPAVRSQTAGHLAAVLVEACCCLVPSNDCIRRQTRSMAYTLAAWGGMARSLCNFVLHKYLAWGNVDPAVCVARLA